MKRSKFHGYIGNIAVLKDGNSVKILGGHGFKLFVKTLDGALKECYHEDLQYVMEEQTNGMEKQTNEMEV